ncbi:helix-turn-helix transcriptional regulator [Streptomyces sp. NPDC050617]|uniref:helix-turn-helix domain-containing protein n=1 Tax=Streptomyces sp. NPDC050617 TaxID=3154628 RepID=UPI00341CAF93
MTARKSLTPRQKYGQELRLRRQEAGLTQEELSEEVVCSPSLISHIEAGRRLPSREDAKRLDQVLKTNGWFSRWLEDLEERYADHFAVAAELERQAIEIREHATTLIPGLLQTDSYARAVYTAFSPNYVTEDLDRRVVNRTERSRILDDPTSPVMWTLLDEAVLRRPVGGPAVMAAQLGRLVDMAENGRLRLHVIPFAVGAHALMESMLSLMAFTDTAPVAYVEGVLTGTLMDDPALVFKCRSAYDLAISEALPQADSLALIRAVAEEYRHEQ